MGNSKSRLDAKTPTWKSHVHSHNGQYIIGDYEFTLYPPIGSRSFGQVVKGTHNKTKVNVAVKIITYRFAGEKYEGLERLALEEKDKMFSIQKHENIVEMMDYHVDLNSVFLIMELCNLGDLEKYLKGNPNIEEHNKMDILHQISRALVFLHNRKPPIIHRDIKPGNVLMPIVDGQIYAKVCDFGFARLLDEGKSYVNTNSAKGTTLFNAPEMFETKKTISYSTSADVFSLGLLFHVVWRFSPTNTSLLPDIAFGKELKEAAVKATAPPVLVEIKDDDSSVTQDLKRLILKMTMLDSKRIVMEEVQHTLLKLTNQLQLLTSKLGQGHLSLRVKMEIPWSWSITEINGDIWLCHFSGIIVYSPDFELLRKIWHKILRGCCTAALLPDGDVVAVGLSGAAVISKTGTLSKTICTEGYYAARVHGGKAYMVTRNNRNIHVYDCEQWAKVHDIAIPCTCFEISYWHTLVITARTITVACGWKDTIYLLSHSGDLQSTIGPDIQIIPKSPSSKVRDDTTTASRLSLPRLCENVYGDSVLVADCWNHRLLVLSAEGKWRSVHLQGDMRQPRDATFANDRLYVVNEIDKDNLSIFV